MLFAIVGDNKKAKPSKGMLAVCPACHKPVIAKCGSILIHHWSHLSGSDCSGKEPMTQWHYSWQEFFASEHREIVMCNGIIRQRADLCLPQPNGSKLIVEFQCSSISVEEISKREQFYTQFGHLLWVFDAQDFCIKLELASPNSNIYKFIWSPPRKSLWVINSALAFDIGNHVLLIASGHQRNGRRKLCGGWGWLMRKKEFVYLLPQFTEQFTFDNSKPLWLPPKSRPLKTSRRFLSNPS
ncbi:MAG: competence protein CoiA [Fischerella sp. CENA71]|nr:competence protein CoiA [Fischerella sp. CENA71]